MCSLCHPLVFDDRRRVFCPWTAISDRPSFRETKYRKTFWYKPWQIFSGLVKFSNTIWNSYQANLYRHFHRVVVRWRLWAMVGLTRDSRARYTCLTNSSSIILECLFSASISPSIADVLVPLLGAGRPLQYKSSIRNGAFVFLVRSHSFLPLSGRTPNKKADARSIPWNWLNVYRSYY